MNKPAKQKSNPRITELEDQLKRVAADFDNFRKRTEEEKKTTFGLAQAQTLLELAPVLDNFRRATEHLPNDLQGNNWVTGVLYIQKQLEQIFTDHGVKKIATTGEQFSPQLHEAVSTEPHDTIPAHHIISELESGYTMNDQVLKPAKVKVSEGPVVS
jgi:molecular chaperone GrpE